MTHRVFGIRHHGPGCARSLRAALDSFAPDCVLVEGPPDAEPMLGVIADQNLRPPVALLVYVADDPRRAVFYPFAVFSPEWQALRFAHETGVPARFMDLPCAHRFALKDEIEGEGGEGKPLEEDSSTSAEEQDAELHEDPIGLLAEAAGFDDREQWWDMQVEQRRQATGLFEAIQEAMNTLRDDTPPCEQIEEQREAHMRTCIRKAVKDGFQRIAVVCGAWHAPALATLEGKKRDAELLKGLPKTKVAATWIPWTHSRLSFRSGYGAGVDSPGFYAHVWEHDHKAPLVWAIRAARLLRSDDLDASSASVIETVRLAETLAVMRELPAPGLGELREAILAVLCGGDPLRVALIRDRLEIGEELGSVPEGALQVPIQRDFEAEAKRLRLKLTTEHVVLELDLRKDTDRDRSRLLHRLRILGLEWGQPASSGRAAGTFRENWRVSWQPEFIVELVAANLYGNTVPAAARAKLRERASKADVPELARLIELALIADLPEAIAELLTALDARAAQASDVRVLMDATEPLARVARYGDVRGTRAPAVVPVVKALFERALVGLLPACTQLDDDAAAVLLASIDRAHAACLLLDENGIKEDWLAKLRELLDSDAAHPRLRGRVCRLLIEQQELTGEELQRRTSLALSAATEPALAARWLEGLVAGEGLFLVHHEELIATLDAWLSTLNRDVFQAELPLLRRAFAGFAAAERRAFAQKLRGRGKASPRQPATAQLDFDSERAARVLPTLARILGVEHG